MANLPGGDVPATGTEAPPEQGGATTTASPARAATPERTRAGAAFNSLVAGAVVLILLLVFILENTQSVKIGYFGITWHMSLGIALLFAAVGGALLVGLVGTVRVMQLRHRVRRGRS